MIPMIKIPGAFFRSMSYSLSLYNAAPLLPLGSGLMAVFLAICLNPVSSKGQGLTEPEREVQEIFKEKEPSVRISKLVGWFADFYQFNQSATNAKALLPYARRMEREAGPDPLRKAEAWQVISQLYGTAKNYEQALIYANRALEVFNRHSFWKGIARLRFHKAYLKMNNSDENAILPECRELLALSRQKGLDDSWVEIASWVAGFFNRTNQPDSARRLLEETLKKPGISYKRQIFNIFDLGNSYIMLGNNDAAETHYRKAYALCLKNHYYPVLAVINASIANVVFQKGYPDSAEKLMERVIPLIPRMPRLDLRQVTYSNLMDINEAQEDYPKAFEYAKICMAYQDSIYQENNQTEYRELEEKYQAELKDKELRKKDAILEAERQKRKTALFGLGGLLAFLTLSGGLYYVNRKRMESRLQQRISEGELKALRAQMNPHFIFNTLNSIQQMVLAGDNTHAFRYLDIYSKLTRQILENSEKKWITLAEEVQFLELYLKMESLRFDGSFQWEITIGEEILPNTDEVPTLLVQPLAENAIKHGLLPKEGPKHLKIHFGRQSETGPITVVVSDNGVGRQEKSHSAHRSMAMEISNNRLALIIGNPDARMEFTDLKNPDGSAAGTEVRFSI